MKRVEFRLSMPNRGSWNDRWSGEGLNYLIYRSLTEAKFHELIPNGMQNSWHYRWSDGWCAKVTCRLMAKGERRKRSAGFCNYDWMVNSIIEHNKIIT